MSKGKREKSSKLKIVVPVICVVVVGVTFYMLHDIQNRIDEMDIQNTVSENVVEDENIVNEEENVIDENTVENEVSNIAQNQASSNTSKNTTSNTSSTSSQAGVTDQKQKAIDLVKAEWGEDDTVSFSFDYINENGEYVIAVKDKTTATVKYYFRVNLDTETVELD